MIAGVFDEFFGVPMHPFAVHAPVVLAPFAASMAVVFVLRSDWRHRASWGMSAAVLALVAMLFVAKESGESALAARNVFGDVSDHQELAEQTFVIVIVWFVITLGLFAFDRLRSLPPTSETPGGALVPSRDPVALGLSVLAAVAAIVATIWLIRTGHAGAASRWDIG